MLPANPEQILFLDIETVPQFPTYEAVPEIWQHLWNKKANLIRRKDDDPADNLYERAGIYAEFGKIICITIGMLEKNERLDYFLESFEWRCS